MAPYSPAVKAGNVVYVSGAVAIDKDGKTVGVGDCAAQTRHVLESIKTLVEAAGGSMRGRRVQPRIPERPAGLRGDEQGLP